MNPPICVSLASLIPSSTLFQIFPLINPRFRWPIVRFKVRTLDRHGREIVEEEDVIVRPCLFEIKDANTAETLAERIIVSQPRLCYNHLCFILSLSTPLRHQSASLLRLR